MKKLISGLLVLSLIVVGISSVGFAFGGPGGKFNSGGPYYNQQVYNNPLDLTEEQEEKLEDLYEDFFDRREDIIDELRDKNDDLRELVLNETSNNITGLKDEIEKLQNQLLNLRIEHWNELKNILTSEQLEKLEDNGFGIYRSGMYGRGWNNCFSQSQGRPFMNRGRGMGWRY